MGLKSHSRVWSIDEEKARRTFAACNQSAAHQEVGPGAIPISPATARARRQASAKRIRPLRRILFKGDRK
jgi:hypothetical protein